MCIISNRHYIMFPKANFTSQGKYFTWAEMLTQICNFPYFKMDRFKIPIGGHILIQRTHQHTAAMTILLMTINTVVGKLRNRFQPFCESSRKLVHVILNHAGRAIATRFKFKKPYLHHAQII